MAETTRTLLCFLGILLCVSLTKQENSTVDFSTVHTTEDTQVKDHFTTNGIMTSKTTQYSTEGPIMNQTERITTTKAITAPTGPIMDQTTGDTTLQLLPNGWDSFCRLKNNSDFLSRLDFQCIIDKQASGKWRLDTLRIWISIVTVPYTMDVKCVDGATISLPWPVKARNLVKVKVRDCLVEDYFMDYGNTYLEPIPDQLVTLDLANLLIMMRFTDVQTIAMNIETINKDYTCGSEDTLERFTMRNISYGFHQEFIEFMMHNASEAEDVMKTGDEFLTKSRDLPFNCVYRRLTYYDQSISNTKAKLHMEVTTDGSRFPALRMYNMSRTGVNRIHEQIQKWYYYFKKLEYMDLSWNRITELQFDDTVKAYEGDIPLMRLDLSYNKISRITVDHIMRLVKVPNLFVNLTGNRINCSCDGENKALLRLVRDRGFWNQGNNSRYEYVKLLQCGEPERLRGVYLGALREKDLGCPVDIDIEYNYGPIIGLSVLAVFLIAVIIVLAKFRREIRILTYTRFNIILPCQHEEMFENKRYDAFVSYSSADQDWVSKVFEHIETSENELMRHFKFCLHHRDFIPGKTIFDNVIDSVETSRHTVIVLSRNFLNSHYCMYEFHEAFQQSIIERKKHLIVILLEDIPMAELPNDLKRCLKTFTYIKKDDIIFEDRLVFALSYKGIKRGLSRSESESTAKTLTSQISRDTDITSDGNMSPSVISTNSVFPNIISPDDFINSKEKSEMHV